jgi:hypothetical protein
MSIFRNKSGKIEYSDLDKFTIVELKKIANDKMNLSISSKSKKAEIIKEIKECIDESNGKKYLSSSMSSTANIRIIPKSDQYNIDDMKLFKFHVEQKQLKNRGFAFHANHTVVFRDIYQDMKLNDVTTLKRLLKWLNISSTKLKKSDLIKICQEHIAFE